MYAHLDEYTNEFTIALPEKLNDYFSELSISLNNNFGFEPINKENIQIINQFIIDWFFEKGIELPKLKESE